MIDFSRLEAQVSRDTSVNSSAAALIADVVAKLRDMSLATAADQAKVNELADALEASQDALAAAVSAGTPAEEPVPTEPVPTEPVPTEPVPTEPVPSEPIQ